MCLTNRKIINTMTWCCVYNTSAFVLLEGVVFGACWCVIVWVQHLALCCSVVRLLCSCREVGGMARPLRVDGFLTCVCLRANAHVYALYWTLCASVCAVVHTFGLFVNVHAHTQNKLRADTHSSCVQAVLWVVRLVLCKHKDTQTRKQPKTQVHNHRSLTRKRTQLTHNKQHTHTQPENPKEHTNNTPESAVTCLPHKMSRSVCV